MKSITMWLVVPALVVAMAPASADEAAEEARALFREGNRLYAEGDYVGALAMFRKAYARSPNAKILLNIGATLIRLGRHAEAIEVFEQYLVHREADPKKRPEVEKVIADLVPKVATLNILVDQAGVRVTIDGRVVSDGAESVVVRVDPGSHTVAGEKPGLSPSVVTVTVRAGEQVDVKLVLMPVASVGSGGGSGGGSAPTAPEGEAARPAGREDVAMARGPEEAAPPAAEAAAVAVAPARVGARGARLSGLLRADIDGEGRGAVALAGATYETGGGLEVGLAVIVGNTLGVHAGGAFHFGDGALQPVLALGVPAFFDRGVRPGIQLGAGLRYRFGGRLAAMVQLGGTHFPNAREGHDAWVLVPSLGAQIGL